ncbi:MAG: phage antirepressor KilAC domain-containing protein [Marinifilaceae bacterium]
MNELIRITEQNGQQAVSARDLHQFLESKQDFSTWMKNRIDKYGFVENIDYCSLHKIVERETGATTRREYALTIDTAKQLAMVEGNDKGKQARRYFIDQDNAYRKMRTANQVPGSFRDALLLAAQQQEEIEKQKALIAFQAPKVLFAQAVETSQKSILIGEMAKILKQNGVDMVEKRFFEWLRVNGYLCSHGERYNQPTQRSMERELFEMKKTTITKPSGEVIVKTTTKVSGKGQIYFVNKFKDEIHIKQRSITTN